MSKPNRWHPCLLPDGYRERLKQYQANCERGIEESKVGGESDDGQETESVREIDRQAAQFWNLTDAGLVEIQRSLKELTELEERRNTRGFLRSPSDFRISPFSFRPYPFLYWRRYGEALRS